MDLLLKKEIDQNSNFKLMAEQNLEFKKFAEIQNMTNTLVKVD